MAEDTKDRELYCEASSIYVSNERMHGWKTTLTDLRIAFPAILAFQARKNNVRPSSANQTSGQGTLDSSIIFP